MTWTVASVVSELRETDESERIEAKSGLGDATLKTVSSFSNEIALRGGWIVFGVRRDDRRAYLVTGIADPDQLQSDLVAQCRGALNRPVTPTVRVDRVEGKRVVVAYIPEARPEDKPIYLKKAGLPKEAFRRIGSVDRVAMDDDLARFASLATRTPFDRRIAADATRADLDSDAIAAFRRQLRDVRPASELLDLDDDALLEGLGAGVVRDGTVAPTMAGLLLFGSRLALRRLAPSLRIDVITTRGPELGDDYDVVEIREALVTGWRKVFRAAGEGLPRRVTLAPDSWTRQETPRIPDRVLREAVVNALVHRDLEVHGPLQIRLYPDRIELDNPGHSLVEEEDWGRLKSVARNPTLAAVFRDLDLAETRGTGIRRMRERMQEVGMSLPELVSSRAGNHFQLTLRLHHLLDEADWEWLARFRGLDDVDRQILVFAERNDGIRNEDVRSFSRDDVLAASARLGRLRDRDLLDQHGLSKQDTWYRLSKEARRNDPAEPSDLAPPQSSDLVPQSSDLAAQSSDLAPPQSSDLAPQSSDLAPQSSDLTPQSSDLDGKYLDLDGKYLDLDGKYLNLDEKSLNLDEKSLNLDEKYLDLNEKYLDLEVEPLNLDTLPLDLRARLAALGMNARHATVEALVLDMCRVCWCEPRDLGRALGRHRAYVLQRFLKPLFEQGKLVRRFPDSKHHPQQAYRTVDDEGDA